MRATVPGKERDAPTGDLADRNRFAGRTERRVDHDGLIEMVECLLQPGAADDRERDGFAHARQTAARSCVRVRVLIARLTADTMALRDAVEMSPSIPTPQSRSPST